jgi:hypothetical protein
MVAWMQQHAAAAGIAAGEIEAELADRKHARMLARPGGETARRR